MKILAALVAMLLLSTGAAYARGHGGGHHTSGGHHGAGYHYSHGYTTKKGTHVGGGYRHNPRKRP